MTNLRKLDVSLTKHGAHKVAELLAKYDKDELLKHLTVKGSQVEQAQVRKTLAAGRRGPVPQFWNDVRPLGQGTIDALVLLAILFSHHELIGIMQNSVRTAPSIGRVQRKQFRNQKSYTNFSRIVDRLGYSTGHKTNFVDYDLRKLFDIPKLNTFVAKLLALKLAAAGWDQKNPLADEATSLGLHDVLGISAGEFSAWLATGHLDGVKDTIYDEEFFENASDTTPSIPFRFKSGHKEKKTGTVIVTPSRKTATVMLLHNEIQNQLVEHLEAKYGKQCVGTEQVTAEDTAIDVVVKTEKFCWFYEIKTADSVKGCIRQAIPQLLEYAYWHGNDDRADKLIIVSQLPITPEGDAYLKFLRSKFKLEIYYEQFTLKATGTTPPSFS